MEYKVTGTFDIVNLIFQKEERFELPIGSNCSFIFPLQSKIGSKQKFELLLSSENSDENVIKQKIVEFIECAVSSISFAFRTPVEYVNIDFTQNEKNDAISASSKRKAELTGADFPKEDQILLLKKIATDEYKDKVFLLKLYRQSLSPDLYATFWHVYTILMIVIGERREIDLWIQDNFPNLLPLLHNDYTKENETILLAIRDTSSHRNATFSGNKLNIDIELKIYSLYFRDIAHKAIVNHLKV